MGEAERALGEEKNSIGDIRVWFEEGKHGRPMVSGEFVKFWKSLSEEDKLEFKKADLK